MKDCVPALVAALLLVIIIPHSEAEIYPSNNFDFGDEPEGGLLMKLPSERFRLPLDIIPFHYKLEMMPILEEVVGYPRFTAIGIVRISVKCEETTDRISLHALNLTIDHSSVKVVHEFNDMAIGIKNLTYDTEKDFFIIDLVMNLDKGENYYIFIDFIAPIPEDRLNGMYLDYYDDPETGDRKYIATTLFAPYHTRRAFPCFDEPNLRATYDISIGRHENYHSLSNAEIINSYEMENLPGWYWDVYNTTPSISSYIIAMIVSDFSYEQAPPQSFGNKSVRVYAPYYLIDRGAGVYGSQLTADVLTYFEEYFVIKYPLPKMFSIALPHFFFNAMENWGLITYKDPVLLYMPNETTEAERYRINYVVSHELAHQWFGNLVNCQWWAYVWLKEGFATFYAHYGINHTHPELDPWIRFVPNVLQVAMNFDQSNLTHPLENFPPTSAAVADIYTRIPYEKGASILRMTSSFLGESIFTLGIRQYVDRFQYKGAVQDDMFQALQEALDSSDSSLPTDIKSIMDTWTRQSGFPLITVSVRNESTLHLTQEKYVLEDPSNPNDTWWVPVTLSPKLDPSTEPDTPDVWIPQGITEIDVIVNTAELIIVNPNAKGYYRVMYDNESLQKIQSQLVKDHRKIPSGGRSQLLDDYFNLAKAGYISYEAALSMTSYLEKEIDLGVWKTIFKNIKPIYNVFVGTRHIDSLKNHFSEILTEAMNLLDLHTKNGEFGAEAILKSQLLEMSCLMGSSNSDCSQRAQAYVEEWKNSPETNPIPVDLQEAVYCGVIAYEEEKEGYWDFIYHKYFDENIPSHRSRLAKALSCTKQTNKQKWLLEKLLSEGPEIHEQDKSVILQYLSANSYAKKVFMEYLQDNPKILLARLKSAKLALTVLTSLSLSVNSAAELEFIEMYIEDNQAVLDHEVTTCRNLVAVAKENLIWMEKFATVIDEWFITHSTN